MSEPQFMVPYKPQAETRKGGKFEDVQRPNQQTAMHGLLRFGQIILILLAAFSWAKVAEAYEAETLTGRLAELIGIVMLAVTLAIAGVLFAKIAGAFDMNRTSVITVVIALLVAWALFNALLSPVIVFALVKIQSNPLYLFPVIAAAAAASFVPSFEVGRYSFWRELVDQAGTNSEKPVIDETQIAISKMKIDWEREQAEAREATLKAEIERLNGIIQKPQPQVIDGEPTFPGQRTIEDCIKPIKVNGHWEYDAMTRNGPRRLDSTLLVQFVIEGWAHNKFERRYWLERGLKRDDWEAMRGAVDWAMRDGKVIRGVDDVLAEMLRFGVINAALYPTPPIENDSVPVPSRANQGRDTGKKPENGAGG